SFIGIAVGCRTFGPFILMPAIATLNTISFAVQPARQARRWVIMLALLSIVVPIALEALGVLSRSYVFQLDAITIIPHAVYFPEASTVSLLCVAHMVCVVLSGLWVGAVRDQLHRSEEKVHRFAWQLRQLAPHHLARLS